MRNFWLRNLWRGNQCAVLGLAMFAVIGLTMCAPCVLGAEPSAKAVPATQAVAIISKGKGTALVGAKAIPLRPYRAVYPGWRLTCAPDSDSLVVVFSDKTVVTLKPKGKPYRVPFVLASSGMFDSVLVPAGRDQSPGGEVFSPPPDGRVWPSHLVFGWTPLPKGTSLKLILRRSPAPRRVKSAIARPTTPGTNPAMPRPSAPWRTSTSPSTPAV